MGICHNKQYEREFVNRMNEYGKLCFRIAGSGCGKEACCDTILVHNGITYLVEVKATKEKVFYVRGRIKEQLNELYSVAVKNSLKPILAIKFKHKGWNIVQLKEQISNKVEYEVQNESSNLCPM